VAESERDKQIREEMERKLGVEFYTPNELEERMRRNPPTASSPAIVTRSVSISELIIQCNEAMSVMSQHNPHKMLIFNCAVALRQLTDRLYELEHPKQVS